MSEAEMDDLEKLRALAERAIWGAWRSRRSQFPSTPSFEIETELPCINGLSAWVPIAFLPVPMRAETEMTDGVISPKSAEATAAFIAAAHPAAILDLIARVERTDALIDAIATAIPVLRRVCQAAGLSMGAEKAAEMDNWVQEFFNECRRLPLPPSPVSTS